jgi:uncharacterized protein YqhQ
MDNYTMDDMIAGVLEDKPETFKDVFNDLMLQKVSAAIEDKKIEVAVSMFNNDTEEESAEQEDTKAEEHEEENV